MSLLDVLGGNAANTDRKKELEAYGDLERVFNQFQKYASQDRTAGAINEGRAGNFYSSILSGDPSKVAAAVAPASNASRQTGEQEIKQLGSFGNRSGGTNTVAAGVKERGRGNLIDSILGAQTGSAGALAGLGGTQAGRASGELGASGSVASNLGSLALDSRLISQQLHDEAVKKWKDTIAQAAAGFSTGGFAGLIGGLTTGGVGGGGS